NFPLGGEGGVALKGRVGEVARGRAGVVEDVEPELAVVVAHTRAAPEDLLELDHGVDEANEHHVAARVGFGHKLRVRRPQRHTVPTEKLYTCVAHDEKVVQR